jgi:hypothetical protein
MFHFLMILLTAAAAAAQAVTTYVDIHLPVLGSAYDQVVRVSDQVNKQLGNEEINFKTAIPHVTLYLTAFSCPNNSEAADPCVEQLKDAVSSIAYGLASGFCNLTLSAPYAAGTYLMLNVSLGSCLQRYSDTVVNATYSYSEPNQTAPSWVHSLPEPERSEKLHDIAIYGSPNVFSQFQPHVTIAWSEDTKAIEKAAATLKFDSITYRSDILGLGQVGAHGTVVRGKDYAMYNLTKRGHACKQLYKSEPNCDQDHITDGGCVWCDIVDHPAFCTSTYQAHQFVPPPQGQPFQCNF